MHQISKFIENEYVKRNILLTQSKSVAQLGEPFLKQNLVTSIHFISCVSEAG
jgi:hypothetical protein